MVQDYKSAILLLNTLQSNFAAVQQVQNRHDVNKSPDDHKDKMLYYCNKIGYNVGLYFFHTITDLNEIIRQQILIN